MTYVEYLQMVHQRNHALDLLPSLLVLMLAVVPVPTGEVYGKACLNDGPQFACWLAANSS